MIRVLKMDSKNPLIWQKALLSKEVDLILSNQQENCGEAVMASGRVLGAYKKIASQEEQLEEEEGDPNRKPVEGDCPVCYEELKEGGEALVWCNTCGNNIHKVCFTKWSRTQLQNCGSVTCVYCRSPWEDGSNPGKIEGVKDNDGYVNLRDVSQHHNSNNTSLDALYGDTSMWVEASMGLISRRNAARLFHAARGEF
ncbi:unnamed protein product [Ostreobium quekettii]|uniref:RING-type domain-containing protein n=1 Tax=Ostreobium quekettii TaxID=121088 RepID=A0A8S1JEX3_9CHLO|nr:unnamed protein product [Ostreobium quekettii]